MLLMGDEMRRTQRGNNNAYCQDNEVSWLDWSLLDRHRDLHRFVRMLISHRLRGVEMRGGEGFGLSLNEVLRRAEIDWHGVRLGCPDWSDDLHSIACTVRPGRASHSVLAAPDVQRLLGGSGLRTAFCAGDRRRWLAAVDRYGAGVCPRTSSTPRLRHQ